MASAWVETRKTRKGEKHRLVWRDILFKDNGKPFSGSRRTGVFITDILKVEQQRLDKIAELESVLVGQKPKLAAKMWADVAVMCLQHSQKHKDLKTWKIDKLTLDGFTAFIGEILITNITSEDVHRWETRLFETLEPATVGIRLRSLRAALNYARDSGWIEKVPRFDIPEGGEVGRIISAAELATILKTAPANLAVGLVVLLHTGMRLGELFALTWSDLRQGQDGWELTVKTLKRKKGEKQRHRIVPLHARAVAAIGAPGPGRIMRYTRNGFESSFQNTIKAVRKDLIKDLPRTRIHDFRHTWATRFMEATGDLYGLMRLGGWKDLKSVERYQHMTRGRSTAILGLDFLGSDT